MSIKFEHTEVVGWEAAIRGMRAKGFRKTANGRYESFVSNHGKTINLGTYDTPEEAAEAVFEYRANRLCSGLDSYELNPYDGVVYKNNYLVFPNGMIFNLYGERMIGHINRDGYINGIINGRNMSFHRIIASIFCERKIGKDYVNHIDGNKTNNDALNLEWCTKSDNTKHSYSNGLQTSVANPYGSFKVLSSNDLLVIKKLHANGFLDREIAEEIGCSRELVSRKIREMKLR